MIKYKSKIIPITIYFSLIFLFSFLATLIQHLDMSYFIKFFLFEFVGIFLPGAVWTSILCKESISCHRFFAYSYILGFCMSYICYFLTVPFGIGKYISFIYVLLLALSVVIWFIKKKNGKITMMLEEPSFCFYFVLIVMIVFWGISLFMVSSANFLPSPDIPENNFFQDNLYYSGNIAELAKEYPPVNFRAFFQSYSYHYFDTMQLSVIKLLTGIPAFELGMYYSYIQVGILLSLALVILFETFVPHISKVCMILGCIGVIFATGFERKTLMTYIAHLYYTPCGFTISMAAGFLAISTIIHQLNEKKFQFIYWLVTLCSFFLCMGSKGPNGIVFGLISGILLIAHLIQTKNWKCIRKYLISFFVIGSYLVFIIYLQNILLTVSVDTGETVKRTIYSSKSFGAIYEWIQTYIKPAFFAEIMSVYVFAYMSTFPMSLFMVIGIILALFEKVKFYLYDYILLIVILISILLTRVVSHSGLSQMYFLLAVFPIITLLIMRMGNQLLLSDYNKIWKRLVLMGLSVTIFVGCINVFTKTNSEFFKKPLEKGWYYLTNQTEKLINETDEESANSLTYDELVAYRWVMKHTKSTSRIICDTFKNGTKFYPYCAGVFTERYMYISLEEHDFFQKFLDKDEKIWKEIKDYKVEYAILTERVSGDMSLDSSIGTMIYENEGAKVYQLNID